MEKISELVDQYPYIGMDTEFPGDVYTSDSHYTMLRENTKELKLIQLGLTLSDGNGNFPTPHCTWQFNFKFDISKEKFNESSITLLVKSGIDFVRLASSGIEHSVFAEYLITSGLIANPDTVWYGFHTDHDFAYLLKLVSGEQIPH